MPYLSESSYGQRSMPMGSSICMVSVQVHAMRLERAIITPGSYSRPAMPLYSSHQPCGTEGCRKASRPSRVDFQSDVFTGKRAAPKTDMQRYFEARTCSVSSTSAGVFRRSMQSVNSVRTGVTGRALSSPGEDMERSRRRGNKPGAWRLVGLAGNGTNLDPRRRSTAGNGKIAKAPKRNTPMLRWRSGARTSPPVAKTLSGACVAQPQHSRRSFAGCPVGDRRSHNCHAIAGAAGLVQNAMAFSWGATSDPKRRCVPRVLRFCNSSLSNSSNPVECRSQGSPLQPLGRGRRAAHPLLDLDLTTFNDRWNGRAE